MSMCVCKTVQASMRAEHFSQGGDPQPCCLPESISAGTKQSFRACVRKLAQGMALFLYCRKCNTCLNILVKGIIHGLICLPFKLGQEVNHDWYFVVYWLLATIDFSICPCDNSCLHIFRSWDSVQLEMIAFSDVQVFFL